MKKANCSERSGRKASGLPSANKTDHDSGVAINSKRANYLCISDALAFEKAPIAIFCSLPHRNINYLNGALRCFLKNSI